MICLNRLLLVLVLQGLALCTLQSRAATTEVMGWLESVYLQPWGVRIRAKLDTGALTSSLDARDIKAYRKNGEHWVSFVIPYGKEMGYPKGIKIKRPLVRETRVKEHEGDSAQRYVVNIDVCLGGRTFVTEVTLADRSNYNYPMLLGRKALKGHYYIDPGRSFTAPKTCPAGRDDKKVHR